jgi:biopolymer transport protein ExbB
MTRNWLVGAVMAGLMILSIAVAQGQEPASPGAGKIEVKSGPKVQPTLIELLQKGGPVMYPLYLCSILTLAFAIERAFSLRRHKVSPSETIQLLDSAIAGMPSGFRQGELLAVLEKQPSPLAKIAAAGVRRTNRPILEIEKAIEDAAAKEVNKLQRNNRILSSVASVAPLLGLLGTATGIIRTFMTVAATEEALGRTELLAGGIYEALVATAVGLTIAIIALVLYFFFQERVERLVSEIDDEATKLAEAIASKN